MISPMNASDADTGSLSNEDPVSGTPQTTEPCAMPGNKPTFAPEDQDHQSEGRTPTSLQDVEGTTPDELWTFLNDHLGKEGVKYNAYPEKQMVAIATESEHGDYLILIQVARSGYHMAIRFPFRVPTARRPAALELIARINLAGHFAAHVGMDPDDGELTFRVGFAFPGKSYNEQRFRWRLQLALAHAEHLTPFLGQISFSPSAVQTVFTAWVDSKRNKEVEETSVSE